MKNILLFSICCYQNITRYWRTLRNTNHTRVCAFYPSCSNYSYNAIKQHGVVCGVIESLWRVLRCHPWQKGGIDKVKI